MNLKRNPCQQLHPYDFNSCINGKIATMIGCKPFWIYENIKGLRNCTKAAQLSAFLDKVRLVQGMDDNTLYHQFSCLKPCSYVEYKVWCFNLIFIIKVVFVKLAGDPLIVPTKDSKSIISIRFASPTITTEQEEMAYSFQTLIADFGGLLGLFVGFNFLMIWDCLLLVLKCLKTKKKIFTSIIRL